MTFLINTHQCFVATVNPDGAPNIGPKRSTRVIDDEHMVFSEITSKQTWENIERGSKIAIAVVDRETMKGFRFVGSSEMITSGELYDQSAEIMRKAGIPAPLRAVIKVKVEKIYNLGFPGAGEEIV